MRMLVFVAAILVAARAHAEMLPSFHLSSAKAAASVVVVEDGKVVEVWAGDAKVGTPHAPEVKPAATKVVYGFPPLRGGDNKLIDQELAKKGLKRVPAVSGKRMV